MKGFWKLLALPMAAALLLSACGADEPGESTGEGNVSASASVRETTAPAEAASGTTEGTSAEAGTEAASDEETTDEGESGETASGEDATGYDDADFAPVNQYLPDGETRTRAEWIETAKTMFARASETFFDTLYTSDWLELDYDAPSPSPIYTKVENFTSVDEAAADFFAVFSREAFGTAPLDRFYMKDNTLYAAVMDRERDENYVGFDVLDVVGITDGAVEFLVRVRYADSEGTDIFGLKYEDGAYKVNRFSLPY